MSNKGIEIYRYDIFMDFDGTKYKGFEKIELNTEDDLELDAEDLKVLAVRYQGKDLDFQVKENKVFIKTGPLFGEIEIEFEGEAKERLVGIYKAKYNNDYVISTQFESTHARKMFPCVDNPSFKAIFKISVSIPKELHAISNMPIERIDVNGSKKIITFYETPLMSTYLVYLGIGKWEELSKGKIIVATVPGKSKTGEFGLFSGEKSIQFYERYFEIPYALPKMHLIAVPEFAFGAMENWGAITFRESALLAPKDADLGQLKRVAEVVAHEIAHQWFGDLVTMKWWDDLWLNESFATFMSFKAVDSFEPSWNMWDDFLLGETGGALLRDSLSTTHPIHVDVKSPDEIEAIFDDISYGKGASILRMIEYFLGESFRKGLNSYLNHYKFSNARANDLWDSLQLFSNYPIRDIMDSWIMKPGYPYLMVVVERDAIHFEQHRFSLTNDLEDIKYIIPISMKVNDKRIDFIMEDESKELKHEHVNKIKVNLDRAGFYRVLYNNLKDLDKLNPKEVWGLVNDYYYFMVSDIVKPQDYINVVNEYYNENSYLPVNEISYQLFMLNLINKKFNGIAKDYIRKQIGLQSSSQELNSKYLKGILSRRLAIIDHEFAEELSKQFGKDIEPDMREAVYTAYAITTNDFDTLSNKYLTESLDSERLKYLRSMMYFSDNNVLRKTLEWGEKNVKLQDLLILMQSALNENGRETFWSWFTTKGFNMLNKAFEGTAIFGRNLMGVIPILGISMEKEVKEFFDNSPLANDVGVKSGFELLRAYKNLKKY